MSEFSGTIYHPAEPGFPLVIAIFKHNALVAFKPVESEEEGEIEIARAIETLPKLA